MHQRDALALVPLLTAVLAAPAAACAQGADAGDSLRFEVATLKPAQLADHGIIRPAPGGERYQATNVPLRLMIQVAYRVKAEQVVGGPSWVDTDHWDMNAKAERPSSTEELHTMLKNLLADRFALKFHRETKELPVYALTIDKAGPKMTRHDPQSAGEQWIDQTIDRVTQVRLSATLCPMDYFAWRLGALLDRPVIDLTGLKGGYDFQLSYTRDVPPGLPEGAMLNGVPVDTSGPTVFAAIRQQLGLELKPQRGPVDILVIDHAAKPAEN